ncbi:BMC domain-containing protein [Thermincola ferriacetica]
MHIQFIKSPSRGALSMLARRSPGQPDLEQNPPAAIGLVQGNLAEMVAAADIAEKAAQVKVEEIRGVCPQHFTMIAIYGDTAAVECALKDIAGRFEIPWASAGQR